MPLFKRRENKPAQERSDSISVDEKTVDDVLLRSLLAGENISKEQAMNIPAVASAVDLISSSIASMPVRLFKIKNGRVEAVDDDERISMLNEDTRDTLDGYQMKKAMIIDYLMDGNAYTYIRKDGNDVTGLFYVPDEYVAPSILNYGIDKTYTLNALQQCG